MQRLDQYKELIEQTINDLVKEHPTRLHAALFTAARYSLLSSGKRLRPLLALSVVDAYAAPLERALVPAAALELVHTYSLIHDDLPCMDNDDWRRGKPTLHKVYTEGHAVLTGDFLLTLAFQLLAEAPDLSAEKKIQLIKLLASAAGGEGMIAGQVVDIQEDKGSVSHELLHFLHLNKTAALIRASLEFGGIIADCPPEDLIKLRSAGEAIGLAFQYVDDLLDYPNKKDASSFCAVALLGKEKTQEVAAAFHVKAEQELNSLSCPVPALQELVKRLAVR